MFTTYLYSTYTSHSDVFTTSYPMATTEVTLVPMPTGNAKPIVPIASTYVGKAGPNPSKMFF